MTPPCFRCITPCTQKRRVFTGPTVPHRLDCTRDPPGSSTTVNPCCYSRTTSRRPRTTASPVTAICCPSTTTTTTIRCPTSNPYQQWRSTPRGPPSSAECTCSTKTTTTCCPTLNPCRRRMRRGARVGSPARQRRLNARREIRAGEGTRRDGYTRLLAVLRSYLTTTSS